MTLALVIPAFVAGVLMFLAPCTLPLVPGYLSFISGVSQDELRDPKRLVRLRPKILLNSVFFVLGFSLVFIILGTVFGVGGAALAPYRVWLSRVGGLFIIMFGLLMIANWQPRFAALAGAKVFSRLRFMKPGNPLSSLLFGSALAFGWTPCVGPVLGAVLTLAATSATAFHGAFLLAVFSLGLAIPFLMVAVGIGSASHYLAKLAPYLRFIAMCGGFLLVFIGVLLLTGSFNLWVAYFYKLFNFIEYDRLLNYL